MSHPACLKQGPGTYITKYILPDRTDDFQKSPLIDKQNILEEFSIYFSFLDK